jgi:hypothetical protein
MADLKPNLHAGLDGLAKVVLLASLDGVIHKQRDSAIEIGIEPMDSIFLKANY